MLIGVYPGESVIPSSGERLRGVPEYVPFPVQNAPQPFLINDPLKVVKLILG